MPSSNDTKNMFLEILLAPNIVHSKDNEINITKIKYI